MLSIGFENLKISCIIGIHQHERMIKQDIYIDLKINLFSNLKQINDLLENTIDYTEIVKICEITAIENQFFLLETLAKEIADNLLNRFKIKKLFLKIKKPAAIPNASCSFVELVKSNKEYQKDNPKQNKK